MPFAGPPPRGFRLGRDAEEAARRFLEGRGLRALASNVRTPHGELDIVLEDAASRLVVVAEVKARSGPWFGLPAEAVTARKRRRIARAALYFLRERGLEGRALRFDVVSLTPVVARRGAAGVPAAAGVPYGPFAIEHLEGAFSIDEGG